MSFVSTVRFHGIDTLRRGRRGRCFRYGFRDRVIASFSLPGVDGSRVEIRKGRDVVKDGGRGCVARGLIRSGEPVVEVDASTTIQVPTEGVGDEPWFIHLAKTLLSEKKRGEESTKARYIKLLEDVQDSSHSILFDDEALGAVQWYKALVNDVVEYREYIDEAYSKLPSAQKSNITRKEWQWALWIAHSRAFAVPPDGKSIALIPLVDMFNHTTRAKSELTFDRKTSRFQIFFSHDLEAESEILISYGGLSNDVLLPYFGFVEVDNPVDTYTLTEFPFPTPGRHADDDNDDDEQTSALLLTQLGLDDYLRRSYTIRRDGPPNDLLIVLRVLLADQNQIKLHGEKLKTSIDLELELLVWTTLNDHLEGEILRMKTEVTKCGSESGERKELAAPWRVVFLEEKIRTAESCTKVIRWWMEVSKRIGRVTTMLVPPGQQTISVLQTLQTESWT